MKLKDTIHFNLYRNLFFVFLFIVCLVGSASITQANFMELFNNLEQMQIVMSRLLHPEWSYVSSIIKPMIETIQMAVVGTAFGVLFALPVAFLATTLVTKNTIVSSCVRFLLNIVRTIPDLLLASLFVAIFGIGSFTGVLTIAVFTFGMTSKLFYEAIEIIDHGPIEAMVAVGANPVQIIFYAIIPQIITNIISYVLYAFEINVRASTILGYVGAGGIGTTLKTSMDLMNYNQVSIMIILIFIVVLFIDMVSNQIRKRFL